jgi:WD40 repeat protein
MNRLEELLVLWQDQSITEPELAELKQLLAGPEARAKLAEDFFTTGVILEAMSTQRVAGASASPTQASPSPSRSPLQRFAPASRGRWWLTTAAAAVLLALGAFLWYRSLPVPIEVPAFAAVEQVQGETFVVTGQGALRTQQRMPAQAGQVLVPGQGIRTVGGDSGAIVKLVDDVWLTLSSDTTVSTSAESTAQRDGSKVEFEQGDLLVEVNKSLGKKKMTVVTPMGVVVTETEQTALHLSDAAGVVVIRGEVDFVQKATGKSIRLKGGQYVATTPDGDLYAARLFSPEAQVWTSFPVGYTESIAVVISPNGKMLAAVTHQREFGLRLGPVDGSQPPMELPGARCVAFSPDSRLLATGDRRDILIYEVATGKRLRVLLGKYPAPDVRCLAFAPDGKTLAVGRGSLHEPGDVELWDLASDTMALPSFGASLVGFMASRSGQGPLLAAASLITERSTIRGSWRGHAAGVTALDFSPDGQLLASGSWDKTVLIWDTAAKQERTRILIVPAQPVRALAFAPKDGRTLAIACGQYDGRAREPGEVKLWDVASETVRATLHGHWRSVTSLAYSPNGQSLVTGSADTTVRFWDAADGREYGMLVKGHKSAIGFEGLAIAFSPDGTRLATASFDRTVKLWKTTKEDTIPGARVQAAPFPRRPSWSWLSCTLMAN